MRRISALFACSIAIGVLTACSEGVKVPIAQIGAPQANVNAGTYVLLDGSGSVDPQGRPLSYAWSFIDRPLGSSAALVDEHTATPSFLADMPGTYVLQLIVSNSVLTSSPSLVTVQVSTCAANAPAIASPLLASKNPLNIGETTQLTANVTDADNAAPCNLNQTLSYSWVMIQQPAGSTATLNSERSETPSLVPDKSGDYLVRLTVTDSTGRSSQQKTIIVTVANCGGGTPAVAPTAVPGTTHPNAAVQLAANASDPDTACGIAQTLTYQWSVRAKPEGANAMFSSSVSASPTFSGDKGGAYELGVVSTDQTGRSSGVGVITVNVEPCGEVGPTVAGIAVVSGASGTPAAGTVGRSISVQAVDVSSLNCLATGTVATEWSLTAPSGSVATLSDAAAPSPSFTPDRPGNYRLAVQVRDSLGNKSAPALLHITAAPCTSLPIEWGTQQPITAIATDPQAGAPSFTDANGNPTPHVGALVQLTPHATVPSYCGSIPTGPLSWSWTLTSRASESEAALDSATTRSPSFRVDKNGHYGVSVVATDALGNRSAPKTLELDTTGCGVNPVTTMLLTGTGAPLVSSPQLPVSVGSFAPFTIAAQIVTDDNDAARCPSRFQVSADFSYSVEIQPAKNAASLSNVFGDFTVFEAREAGAYAVRVDGAVTNLAGRVHASPAFAYLALAAPPTVADLPPFVGASANVTATLHGTANAAYACTISNGAFLSGTASGILSAGGSALLSLIAGGTPGALTISCFQVNGAFATGAGTAVSQVVGQPSPPSIQVAATLTTGRTYTASVSTRGNATYLWSLDNGGAIVSAGGASGTTSADGSTNSIRFTTGPVGVLHLSVTETDVVGHLAQGAATITVVGGAVGPTITAAHKVTSTRTYTASVPARGGFTYRWEVFNGSISPGAETGLTADGLNTLTFTAGSATASNAPAAMTLTCTETNATGDSSAPGTFTATVYPNPIAPAITVVKLGTATPITAVSAGPSFVYVASVIVRAQMHYVWSAPAGITGASGGASNETFTFSVNAGVGTPEGVAALLQATELNFIDDFATGSTQLTVFTAPSGALAIATTAATDSGTNEFLTTSGRTYTASIVSRGGLMSYQWSGDNAIIGAPGTGGSTPFTAGSANADNSAKAATLRVRETNGAGDSAESSRDGLVYPAPQAPTYRVARAPSGPGVTNQKITQTFEYMATLVTRAEMTYAWHIVGGTFTGGGTDSSGTFIDSGAKNQVHFSTDDAFPSTIPTTVSLQVSEDNFIGDSATIAQPDLTAFPTPISPSFAAGTTDLTAGDTVTVSLAAPRTNLFYDWTITNGTFSNGTTTAVGSSVTFTPGAANPEGSPRALILSVSEVNGTPDSSAPFGVTYHVFPKPAAPVVTLARGVDTLADGAAVTEGDAIHGSITSSSQPGITFTWTGSHSNPRTGSGNTFDFTGVNDDAAGNPVTAQIVVTASNAIGSHADSSPRTLQIHPLPAVPDVVLATGVGIVVASGADVTAGSFQATTSAQKSTITYQWTIAPAANRTNVTGDTTANVHFDALANSDGSNATVMVSIAASNVLGASKTADATLVVHPTAQTPAIHIVGPDGNDAFVTQGAAGVRAKVVARAHFHYLWTYAFAGASGISSGTLTNPGGTNGDLDGLTNFVVFTVPIDATQIRLSCTELSDLGVASAPANLQAAAIAPPAIQSFDAQPNTISAGTATRLTAVFTGGTGAVDNGVGPVTSSVSTLATLITETTTFTLTVTNPAGSSTTFSTLVAVSNPTGWVDLNNLAADPINTRTAMPYALAFDPADATSRYASTLTHGVLHTPNGIAPWTEPAAGFPTDRSAFAITIGHPEGKLSLWASVDCTGQLYHSLDSTDWTEVTGSGLPAAACGTGQTTDFKLDPSDPNQKTLYVAFSDTGLFRSTDDGTNWAQIPLPIDGTTSDTNPTKLAIKVDGTVFVGTANGRVFRVSAGTAAALAATSPGGVSAIAVEPNGPLVVVGHDDGTVEFASDPAFVFTTGHVFATPVSGLAFAPDGIGTVIGQPAITGSVYALVANGVWRSIDLGASFANVTASTAAIDDSNYFSVTVHPVDATTIFVLGGTPPSGSSGFFGRTF